MGFFKNLRRWFLLLIFIEDIAGKTENSLEAEAREGTDDILRGEPESSSHFFSRFAETVILVLFDVAISYNQPIFCPDASWNQTAITFVSSSFTSYSPNALFVSTKDTLFMVDSNHGYILIWNNGSVNPTTTISAHSYSSISLFVNDNDVIFISGGSYPISGVNQWTSSGAWTSPRPCLPLILVNAMVSSSISSTISTVRNNLNTK